MSHRIGCFNCDYDLRNSFAVRLLHRCYCVSELIEADCFLGGRCCYFNTITVNREKTSNNCTNRPQRKTPFFDFGGGSKLIALLLNLSLSKKDAHITRTISYYFKIHWKLCYSRGYDLCLCTLDCWRSCYDCWLLFIEGNDFTR